MLTLLFASTRDRLATGFWISASVKSSSSAAPASGGSAIMTDDGSDVIFFTGTDRGAASQHGLVCSSRDGENVERWLSDGDGTMI